MINVTNGKVFRLLVDDEPFDVRYGKLVRHERTLDLRDGVLRREAEWISPAGQAIHVRSTRMVSFVQRSIAAILYEVEPIGARGADRRAVRARGQRAGRRPSRAIRARPRRWPRRSIAEEHVAQRAPRQPRAPHAQERPAHGRRHGPRRRRARGHGDRRRERTRPRPVDGQHRAQAGREAADRQVPRLRLVEPAIAAVAARPGRPGARLGPAHRLGRAARRLSASTSPTFWERADIELDGDAALQQAVRFALFHVVQAAARAELRAIPAKGLTGKRLRRPHVLGHGRVHAAGADLRRCPTRRATRSAGATRRWTSPERAPRSWG